MKDGEFVNIDYNRDMFIFGKPIFIQGIGYMRFLKYEEYLENFGDLNTMKMNVLHIYHQFRKMLENEDKSVLDDLEDIKKESLFDIVLSQNPLINAYIKILSLTLDENDKNQSWDKNLIETEAKDDEVTPPMTRALTLILSDAELFMSVRQLVLDMQMMAEDAVSPNPIVQKRLVEKREMEAVQGNKTTPTDIATSIVAGTSISFSQIVKMTVIQVNAIFYRLGAFKNYDANILFMSAGADIKNAGSWSQNIDLFKEEEQGVKGKEFERKFGSMLKK